MLPRLSLALLCASFAEALVAAAGLGDHVGRVGAALGAGALVFVAGTPPIVAMALFSGTSLAITLGRAATRGLGAGQPALALLNAAGAGAVATGVGAAAGRALLSTLSPRMATIGTALSTLVAFVLSLALAAFASRLIHGLSFRLLGRSPMGGAGISVALLLLAWGCFHAVTALLPTRYAPAPCAALVALAVFGYPRISSVLAKGTAAAVLWLFALPLVASAGILLHFDDLPARVRVAIDQHPPYAAPTLRGLRWFFDRDGDGAASVLGGGDCNDADPSIHPEALDQPENHIDENCSGVDARRYLAPKRDSTQLPGWLKRPQNLVVIQLDALRPDHLGFAGYRRPTSPNLDRFAARALFFRNAYTPSPSTRFAMSSMFSGYDVGRLPHRNLPANRFELGPEAVTLAERLQDQGYDTAGYTISYVIHHNLGLGQGFEHWQTPWPTDHWAQAYRSAAEQTTRASVRYIEQRTEASVPYLLFVHYRCTHDPYFKYEAWDFGDEPIDRYDSALAHCDDQLSHLLAAIDRSPQAGHTTIAIVSDHGELFGEHGLTHHGKSLYEPDVRILMLLSIAGIDARVIETPVSLLDLAPTLAELAGLQPAPDGDGSSLLAPVFDPARSGARPLFLFTSLDHGGVRYRASAVVDWPLKLIRDRRVGSTWLFDVQADPLETEELGRTRQSEQVRLLELLDGYEYFAGPR
ncbi:MAG: sulfatase-like hydrolase/transferase [Myxococcales bacterium]|nr:sulfatase-like hydrolase/transferase [Myxococcales bacterium]